MISFIQRTLRLCCYSMLALVLHTHTAVATPTTIVTTLPPLSALVTWLAPHATVHCLLPAHADPHHMQLTPKQVEQLKAARLLLRSSRDDGHWTQLRPQGKTLDLWPSEPSYTHEAHKHEHEHEKNSHAWLNPQEVARILPQLAQALIRLYPQQQAAIEQRTQEAIHSTQVILQEWQQQTQKMDLQHRGVLMQHPAWLNFFHALNMPVWQVLESGNHGQEQGPRVLDQALRSVQQHPHSLLIGEQRHSNRALSWLHQHHPESTLITLDALGSAHTPWVVLMRHNLHTLTHP